MMISSSLNEPSLRLPDRFKTFESHRTDLINVFDLWDRTKGVTRNPPTPTNQSEEEHTSGGAGAGVKKVNQKKDKGKDRREECVR